MYFDDNDVGEDVDVAEEMSPGPVALVLPVE
jgi:hypothetical protein